jgi:hypothetical protein
MSSYFCAASTFHTSLQLQFLRIQNVQPNPV